MTALRHLALLAFLTGLTPMAHAAADPVATTAPVGDYQFAWLQLEKGAPPLDQKAGTPVDAPLFLALRDGKVVASWFAHPALTGGRIVWMDRSAVKLDGKRLAGEFAGRTSLHWGSKVVHDYAYRLDSSLTGNKLAGSFTATFVGEDGSKFDLKGKFAGRLLSSQDAKSEHGLASGKNWPHYYGDGFGLAGPSSEMKLVDDLAQARPVWKSEAFVPTAYGSAPDSRYFDRAGRTDNGGGSSSPVVVDGRVYQFFYYPRGPVGLDREYGKYRDEADLVAKARELFPKREIQQKAIVNHFRTQADEFLVCMAAATGQTLWKATLPQRGSNLQTHKHRGLFPVALVASGVVYQPGTSGRLYAFEASSGKLLWEYPSANPEPHVTKKGVIDCLAPSPVLVEGVIAYAAGQGVTGVDAKTGKKKWEQPLAIRSSLLTWKGKEKALILATSNDHQAKQNHAVALDPATGKIVWQEKVAFLPGYTFPLLADDLLVGYSLKRENVKAGTNDGLAVLHAYRVSEKGLTPEWTTKPLAPVVDTVGLAIQGGHVYVTTAADTFCLSLAKGEVVSSIKDVGGARTQTLCAAHGRLFLQPEGRHGKQSFVLLDANPKQLAVLGKAAKDGSKVNHPVGAGKQWLPPHPWTTAYANQPIVYPVVDGRMFVRGLDSVYCYDLRKAR